MGTLVERTTRFLILVPLAGRDALTVSQAIIAMAGDLPAPLKRSLTWDCGAEMARHSEITAKQFPVYFAHPHSPWQRGSNENLNRLVREYFPQGTAITSDRDYLATVAGEINTGPVRSTTGKTQRSVQRTPHSTCFHQLNTPRSADSPAQL